MQKIVAAFFLLLFMQSAFSAEEYGLYVNERYGYSVEYLKKLIPQGVSENGDGQIFRSKSGSAELRVFARSCIEGLDDTPDRYIATTLADKKTGQLKVTYQKRGRSSAVLSGFKNGRTIYKKLLLKDGWCTELNFSYPNREKATYDLATERISASFTR